jgi:hypothetical protein
MPIDPLHDDVAIDIAVTAEVPSSSPDPAAVSHTLVAEHRYLQGVLARWNMRRIRRGETTSHQLIYAGAVPGYRALFARILLVRPPEPIHDQWGILIRLQGHHRITGWRIEISCGDDTRGALIDDKGEVTFNDIPATWIIGDTAPDLIMTILYP